MARYVALRRPPEVRATYDEDGYRLWSDSIQVIVEDDPPKPTGIYDASGTQLYRLSDRQPIGFTAKHA